MFARNDEKTFRKIACCGQINNRKSLVAAILIFAKNLQKKTIRIRNFVTERGKITSNSDETLCK